MPENGIKDAKTVKQCPVGQAAENQTAKNQKGTKMKKVVLFLALFLAACDGESVEPPNPPKDVVDVESRSNDLVYYRLNHKVIKLNDGREIECLIGSVYDGISMDCNWNYKGNQDKER